MNAAPPREPLILWLTVAFAIGFLAGDISSDYREPVEEVERPREVKVQNERAQLGGAGR